MKKLLIILLAIPLTAAAAERIISLSPAVTDMICDIGAAEMLCGISSCCDAEKARHVAVAGDMGKPNVKSVLRLRPTLLVTDTRHPGKHWEQLKKFKIPTLFLTQEKPDDFPAALRLLGRRIGCSAASERAAAKFEQEISGLRRSKPSASRRALIIFNVNPLVSCGAKSFITGSVELAGVKSVTGDKNSSYFTIPSEFLLKTDPEVIISAGVPENAVKTFFERDEFRRVDAVRNRRIVCIDADRFCRAGVRLPAEISLLRKKIAALFQR